MPLLLILAALEVVEDLLGELGEVVPAVFEQEVGQIGEVPGDLVRRPGWHFAREQHIENDLHLLLGPEVSRDLECSDVESC